MIAYGFSFDRNPNYQKNRNHANYLLEKEKSLNDLCEKP